MASIEIQPWTAVCVQANWENYNPNVRGEFEGDTLKKRNLNMMRTYIDACFNVGALQRPVKLVCFPEFSIGGLYTKNTTNDDVKKWQAISIPGPETDRLAEKAKEYNIYIAAVNHENDPAYPDYFFNTAFIINPKGKVILKYRKLNTQFGCNPHDIFDEYVNPITGSKDFFPVVETEIGRLSCGICADIMIPEIPKIYALKGADVWIHMTSSNGWGYPIDRVRMRAIDNTIYVVHENWAARVLTTESINDTRVASHIEAYGGGYSMIMNPYGQIMAIADGKVEELVMGTIDVKSLREKRMTWGHEAGNAVSWTRTELFRPWYDRTVFPPNQVLVDGAIQYPNDVMVTKRRRQAAENVVNGYSFYSENDVV